MGRSAKQPAFIGGGVLGLAAVPPSMRQVCGMTVSWYLTNQSNKKMNE